MLSIEWIRENPILLDYGLSRRNHKPMSEEVLKLDSNYRSILTELEEIRARRNKLATEVANAKKQSKDIVGLITESKELKIKEEMFVVQKDESYNEFRKVIMSLPNMPEDTTWEGMARRAVKEIDQDFKEILEGYKELHHQYEEIINDYYLGRGHE